MCSFFFSKTTFSSIQCNKACGGGTQRRTAKCLEPNIENNEMKEAAKCRYAEREIAYRNCNSHSCTGICQEHIRSLKFHFYNGVNFEFLENKTTTADPTVDLIQNDECQDQFPNCHRVMKARLCSYSYYNTRCCHTCRLHSNELY
jgi:thrombospondin type-1 domain-containing protein 4